MGRSVEKKIFLRKRKLKSRGRLFRITIQRLCRRLLPEREERWSKPERSCKARLFPILLMTQEKFGSILPYRFFQIRLAVMRIAAILNIMLTLLKARLTVLALKQ